MSSFSKRLLLYSLAVLILAVVQTALLLSYISLHPQVTVTANDALDREMQTSLDERRSRSSRQIRPLNVASDLTENQYELPHSSPNGSLYNGIELREVTTSSVRDNVDSMATAQTSQTSIADIHSATKPRQGNGRGYFMGTHSCDQLTGGAMNFLSWQCLSSFISPDVYTVEPFVVESTLGAYFFDTTDREHWYMENNVSLSDIYDIEQWNSFTNSKGIRMQLGSLAGVH